MKKSLIFVLAMSVGSLFSQNWDDNYCINFQEPQYFDQLFIDTVAGTQNLWQIGAPQKPFFNTVVSPPYAIVTDTINFYPVGNTSVFTIRNLVSMGLIYGMSIFGGYYFVASDSLNDGGLIEFSPNHGSTWIDLIHDTVYSQNFIWFTTKPVLTGNSFTWKYFEVLLADIGSAFNIQLGDTVMYRFTFTSDVIPESMGGLMFDDICFFDFVEGITETRFRPLRSSIFPNPSAGLFTIEFDNPGTKVFELAVYNDQSHMMISERNIRGNEIELDARHLKSGIYFYKLTNSNENERSWGKFIVSH